MTTPDWGQKITPSSTVHNPPPPVPPAAPALTLERIGLIGTTILELILAQVALALGNINILGVKPFEFLAEWGRNLQEKATSAYTNAGTAQTSANYANTQTAIATTSALASDVAGGLSVTAQFDEASSTSLTGFTRASTGTGAGDFGPDGTGSAVWKPSGGGDRTHFDRYSTALATDNHAVLTVLSAAPQAASDGGNAYTYLLARVASGFSSSSSTWTWVFARIGAGSAALGCMVAGVETVFSTATAAPKPGDQWTFLAGTDTSSRQLVLKQNGVTVLSYTDSGATSSLGSGYRYVGLGSSAANRATNTAQTKPASLDLWSAADRKAASTDITALSSALSSKASSSHTHVESDITGLVADLAAKESTANKAQPGGYASLDSGGKVPSAQLPASASGVSSVNTRTGAVTLTKSDVGLTNAENTADLDKPISTATQTALDAKAALSHTHTASSISDSTTTGRSVLTAADAAAARTAIGAGTSNLALGTTSTTAKAGNYAPASTDISDSTATGRSLITAVDAAAARTAISAGSADDATVTLTNKTINSPKIGTALFDSNGNRIATLNPAANSVNYLYLSNAASGAAPLVGVTGSDATVGLNLQMRGTGLAITMLDGNSNTMARFSSAASVVNYVNIAPSTANNAVTISSAGTDSNISINIAPKGTGTVQAGGNPVGVKVSVPSTATSTGVLGQWAADSTYLYICTAANTWRRVAISSW